MNPEMAKGIEIGSPETFLMWTFDQPWMVFHELAHGYHDRFLPNGFANREVMQAYGAAKAAGTYHTVMFWDGRLRDGYAETNQMEYFSELSEAYFGCNDMFPFVRGELMTVDPTGATVIATAWGAASL
jgi:hypothetical protein